MKMNGHTGLQSCETDDAATPRKGSTSKELAVISSAPKSLQTGASRCSASRDGSPPWWAIWGGELTGVIALAGAAAGDGGVPGERKSLRPCEGESSGAQSAASSNSSGSALGPVSLRLRSPGALPSVLPGAVARRPAWVLEALPRIWARASFSSGSHSRPPGCCCLRIMEFHRFLMSLSVRLGMYVSEICAHLVPICCTLSQISTSSSGVQSPLLSYSAGGGDCVCCMLVRSDLGRAVAGPFAGRFHQGTRWSDAVRRWEWPGHVRRAHAFVCAPGSPPTNEVSTHSTCGRR